MAILEQKQIYDDSKKAFTQLEKDLDTINKEVVTLTKSSKELAKALALVKKSNDGTEAKKLAAGTDKLTKSTKKLKNALTAEEKVKQDILKQNAKLAQSRTKAAQDLALLKQRTLEQNKALREQAKATLGVKNGNNGLRKTFTGLATKLAGAFVAVQALRGAFNLIVGVIGSTAEGQLFLAKVTGATNAVMAKFKDIIIDGWKSMTDFSSGAEDTRTLIEKLGDAFLDFYSVRGKGFSKFLDAGASILKGKFKDGLSSINDGFVQVILGVEGATEKTVEFTNQLKIMAAFGAAISGAEKKLQLDRSRAAIQQAKDIRTIADLRVKAADKAKFTGKEREQFLLTALSLTRKIGKENEEFANRELALQQAVFNSASSNIDDEIKLNQLKQKADEVAAASLKKQKLLTAELQTAKNEAAKEELANITILATAKEESLDDELESQLELNQQKLNQEQEFQDGKTEIQDIANVERLQKIQDWEDAKLAIQEQALNSGVQLANDIFSNFQDERLAELNSQAEAEKAILQDKLDKGVISEEEFTKKIADIEKKQRIESAKADKKKAVFDIAIRTAIAIISALTSIPPNIPLSIAVGVVGATQAAAVALRPIPKFAEGEVNIGGRSHAQGGNIVEVEKGESYINKGATSQSEGLLNMINDGLITDKNVGNLSKQDSNMFLGGLLMQGNKHSQDLITLMSNMGWTYDRDGIRTINKADGSFIEKFNING